VNLSFLRWIFHIVPQHFWTNFCWVNFNLRMHSSSPLPPHGNNLYVCSYICDINAQFYKPFIICNHYTYVQFYNSSYFGQPHSRCLLLCFWHFLTKLLLRHFT
jgi:hypothetical protein